MLLHYLVNNNVTLKNIGYKSLNVIETGTIRKLGYGIRLP